MISIAPVNLAEFDDGWIRTFRQGDIPDFSREELGMLKDWYGQDKLTNMMVFFTEYKGLDGEMAEYCLHEFFRGNV